jgi:hypothetical protein
MPRRKTKIYLLKLAMKADMIYICPDERQAGESVFVGLFGAIPQQRGCA